ncbi:MAG: recombinase family protein [Cyanobacteriota bacterium]|nr:recombinase family protein [Cyanobacteriota bacterium]
MVIGGYIRVSSAKQRDESDSPASQRQRLRDAGCTVFFEDLAVSGFKLEQRRKAAQFRQLQQAIRQRQISRLVATRLDRIARRDAVVLELAELCESHGVEFVTLGSGKVDTTTASGWLSVKMQLVIAEHFSRQLSENIRHGYQGLHAQGIPARSSRSLPFHLQREPGTRHGVIEGPAWDDARRVVDQLLAGRWTPPQAARFLHEKHGTHGDPKTVVTWMLAPSLAGHFARRDGEILIRDCWPALVSELEHQQIRELLKRRKRWVQSQAKDRQPLALSGLGLCGDCQGTMGYQVAVRNGQRYPYLRCSKPTCRRRNMRAEPIERQLHGALGGQLQRLIDRQAQAMTTVKPSPQVLRWRQELAAREAIPVDFRQPADQHRIQELQGLIQAGASISQSADPETLLRLQSQALDVTVWFDRPEHVRNADYRQLLRSVVIEPAAKQIREIEWLDGSVTQLP